MKKQYQKPCIYVENFALSQAVAQDCGYERDQEYSTGTPGFHDNMTCGWQLGSMVLWDDGAKKCTYDPKVDYTEAGCYNNPSGMNSLFAYS